MKLTETEKKNGYIIAVRKEPNKKAEIIKQLNNLRGYQNAVNGYIEAIPYPKSYDAIDLIVNDSGKIEKLAANVYIPAYKDTLCGNIIAVAVAANTQDWCSLTAQQAKDVCDYLNSNSVYENE